MLSFMQFHTISHNLCYFSQFWANFNILGIKMHVLELRNSMVIFSCTFTHSFMSFHGIFTQFWLYQPFQGQFQHVGYQKTCTQAGEFKYLVVGGLGHPKGAKGPQRALCKSQKFWLRPQNIPVYIYNAVILNSSPKAEYIVSTQLENSLQKIPKLHNWPFRLVLYITNTVSSFNRASFYTVSL